ncbi:Carbohydrate-selective porin, OprB family [Symmachiella macrocystis]|uniref:Carbohydrate-selective porin, OprB family n=1 Tax=Symmachiella macrocystis TaxID=2527985 RepID=A0A5C6AYC0_9PLAN|nr:carbohydrate porin [Symmachiella macrocystis]TWU04149.1 Carbohydrate-selective porin, OprB family [Symmachiella macrocystis]
MRSLSVFFVVFSFLCAPQFGYAQELNEQYLETCDCCDTLLCRDKLTGNWFGHRTSLAQQGIVVESALTQFYQGVASGGAEQKFRYGDKLDLFILGDTGRMGLWRGGKIKIHAVDWQFGQNVIGDAAGLAPVNANLVSPLPEPSFALTHLLYEHELGGGFTAVVGRNNTLDFWETLYPDYGRGVDGFMNMSIPMPMNATPSMPFISNIAAIMKAGERGLQAAFVVMESQESPTTVGLDFPNGVTLVGLARNNTNFGGLRGSHTILGTYATGEYTSFDTSDWVIVPPGGVTPTQQTGSWMLQYLAEQRIWADPCNDRRYTKLFGRVGVSDEDTSPFGVTASVSIEAFGAMDNRPNDRMGMGYFYSGLNSDFKSLFVFANPLEDVHGGEVYYNAEITPWFHLTGDLQVVNPGPQALDTAVVIGLRGKIDF